MKVNVQRVTAWLLSLLLLVSSLPLTAFADDEPETAEDGSYLLATAKDLLWFSEEVTGGNDAIDAQLTADVDLTGEEWIPIGGDSGYCGTFNGNGFTVTLALTADDSYEYGSVGLFGFLFEATVKNLKVAGTIVVESENCQFVGGIAGGMNEAEITRCANTADITVTSEAVYWVGGIAGMDDYGGSTIRECANHGSIDAENAMSVGGLIGSAPADEVSLTYCYNSGSVSGAEYTGGLVGDGEFRISSCYSSAGVEDWGAPNGLTATGQIFGGAPGDLAGLVSGSRSIQNSLCYTDVIVSSGRLDISELENCARFCDCDSLDDILLRLNDGCDEPVFVTDDNGFGEGWPVLAWELKGGSTPGENDKALREAKEQALAEIESLYSDAQIAKNYAQADRTTVSGYRDQAIAAIEAAREIDVVAAALKAMKAHIAAVPTASDRLEDYKKTAIAAVEKAYFYQEVGAYSTRDFGYRSDLAKITVKAGQLGLRHDLKEELLRQLAADMTALTEQKDAGIGAIRAAASQAEVDAEKDAVIAAMEQTVTAAGQRTADNGVTDKWDGTAAVQPAGAGTATDPYRIGTAAELAWFANAVNGGKTGLNAVLTADIDLAGEAWTPIAQRADNARAYSGVFDGAGYTVHGLYVNVTKETGGFLGGLFGYIGKRGTVKSLRVAGLIRQELGSESLRDDVKRKYAVGGIAGCSEGTVYDCESSVALTHGQKYSYCNYIGGLVGCQTGGIIERCVSYAVLFQTGSANFQYCFGGVTGYSGSNALVRYTDSYAAIDLGQNTLGNIGGIVGTLCGTAQIRECRNFGSVHYGNGIVGSVLDQAGVAYVRNSGTVDGEGSLNVTPGAAIAGRVDTSGELIGLYNDGDCVYGLIHTMTRGTVRYAQSSTSARLWGKVDLQHSTLRHCIRVDRVAPEQSTRSDGALGQAKLAAARLLLGKAKTNADSVYGTQSDAYNAVLLEYLRRTELSDTVEEVEALLAEVEEALKAVPTQLMAEREQVVQDLAAYISARLYDESARRMMEELLSEATAEANAAGTVRALTAVREKYLGTDEQPGRFETACDTYPAKARQELYNAYLYGKTYGETELAALYACYEMWGIRMDRAASTDEVDILFADAKKALYELSAGLTETGVQPDMAAVKTAATEAAKAAAQDEMRRLAAEGKARVEELRRSAEDQGYAGGFLSAVQRISETFCAQAEKLAAPDFKKADSFAAIEDIRKAAQEKLSRYTEDTVRRMNTLFSLAAASSVEAWDGVTKTEPVLTDGVYRIANGAELAWFADYVNSGSSRTASAELTADIDLAYREWTPIGLTPLGGNGFYGTLDGKGHKIRGLYISRRNSYGYYGLIGVLRGNSAVRNLDVYGTVELTGVASDECVGALVAYSYDAAVQNCRSYVGIYLSRTGSSSTYPAAIGGLIGKAAAAYRNVLTVSDCAFRGSIVLTETENNLEPRGVGGIVGRIEGAARLLRCANYGTVETDKALGVGGIVGRISTYDTQGVQLTECANWGSVTNDVDHVMDAKGGTGGIVGVIASDTVSVAGCYNTGAIRASQLAGGILGGESDSFGTGSSATGSRQLVLENCYNAGRLFGPNNQRSVKIGSLAGYPLDGTYKDGLYVLSGCAQAAFGWISSCGDSVQITDAAALEAHFADGTGMIRSIAGLNGGHPLFGWQLSDSDVRETVAAYLNDYYSREMTGFVSAEQSKTLSAFLKLQIKTIREETAAEVVTAAYETAMRAMDKPTLLAQAKAEAQNRLSSRLQAYAANYPAYADAIGALEERFAAELRNAETPAQTDTVADRLDAAVVELLIDAIGTVGENMTAEEAAAVKERIETAQAAYEALNDAQRDQVGNFVRLAEARAAMAAWEKGYAEDEAAAADAAEWIRRIGEVTLDSKAAIEAAQNAYDALSEKQRDMVSEDDRAALDGAVKRYRELVEAYNADVDAVTAAAEKIAAIGKVTLESGPAIRKAEEAYRTLTDSQRSMLPEAAYAALQKAAADYAALELAEREQQAAVDRVVERIREIGTVTENSRTAIETARAAYEALTPAQKERIDPGVVKILTEAEAAYAALTEAARPTDPEPTVPSEPDVSEPTAPSGPNASESTAPDGASGTRSTAAAGTRPGNAADGSVRPEQENSSDAGILWRIGGIALAAAVAGLLVYWFVAANRRKRT